jgi:hypothetical protein
MINVPIDKSLKIIGISAKCVEAINCKNCILYEEFNECNKYACMYGERKDGKRICFIENKK